jgi:hypothetical protein
MSDIVALSLASLFVGFLCGHNYCWVRLSTDAAIGARLRRAAAKIVANERFTGPGMFTELSAELLTQGEVFDLSMTRRSDFAGKAHP